MTLKLLKPKLSLTIALFLSLMSFVTQAGVTNPFRYTILKPFPQRVVPGNEYCLIAQWENRLPFSSQDTLNIQSTMQPINEFTLTDGCKGRALGFREACTITACLIPSLNGPDEKLIEFVEFYGHTKVPLRVLKTIAESVDNLPNIVVEVTQPLPESITLNGVAPFEFMVSNIGSATATSLNVSTPGSVSITTCTSSLNSGEGCSISGQFTATSVGEQSVQAQAAFTQGAPSRAKTQTEVTLPQTGYLVCDSVVPLPSQTQVSSSTQVTLLCTNRGSEAITITSHTPTYPTGGAEGTFTPSSDGGDNCTAQILNALASCQLQGVYQAPSAPIQNVTISLLVNYDTSTEQDLSAQTTTQTNIVNQIDNSRIIHLKNQCPFDVWWSAVGGSVANTNECNSDNDCPEGSHCNASAKICYFANPAPTLGGFKLVAGQGEATTTILETEASTVDGDIWKGVISGSTRCENGSCLNNACGNQGGNAACAPGVGFSQPSTLAEFTFLKTASQAVDSYDISYVNGLSIPMAMGTNQSTSNYNCGTAGSTRANDDLKGCSYKQVEPQSKAFYWVEDMEACTTTDACNNENYLCGLAFEASTNSFNKACGPFNGFWALNQICQTDPSFSSPFSGDSFNCKSNLTTPYPDNKYTLLDILKCSPPDTSAPPFNSCYLNYSGYSVDELQQCCGCSDWSDVATPSALCPVNQSNPEWTQLVLPQIKWMKRTCPTAYSYPFDDKASSFQCTAASTTEYDITFCPDGQSALPFGIQDGRQA